MLPDTSELGTCGQVVQSPFSAISHMGDRFGKDCTCMRTSQNMVDTFSLPAWLCNFKDTCYPYAETALSKGNPGCFPTSNGHIVRQGSPLDWLFIRPILRTPCLCFFCASAGVRRLTLDMQAHPLSYPFHRSPNACMLALLSYLSSTLVLMGIYNYGGS